MFLPSFHKMVPVSRSAERDRGSFPGFIGGKGSSECGMLPAKALPRWNRPTHTHTDRQTDLIHIYIHTGTDWYDDKVC